LSFRLSKHFDYIHIHHLVYSLPKYSNMHIHHYGSLRVRQLLDSDGLV
jgi:hypothetical protein